MTEAHFQLLFQLFGTVPAPIIATPAKMTNSAANLILVSGSPKNNRAQNMVQMYPTATSGYNKLNSPLEMPRKKKRLDRT